MPQVRMSAASTASVNARRVRSERGESPARTMTVRDASSSRRAACVAARGVFNRTSVEGPYVLVRAGASTATSKGEAVRSETKMTERSNDRRIVRERGAFVFSHRSFSPPRIAGPTAGGASYFGFSVPGRKRPVRCSARRKAQRN